LTGGGVIRLGGLQYICAVTGVARGEYNAPAGSPPQKRLRRNQSVIAV